MCAAPGAAWGDRARVKDAKFTTPVSEAEHASPRLVLYRRHVPFTGDWRVDAEIGESIGETLTTLLATAVAPASEFTHDVMVCTHGRRDRGCGTFATTLYKELEGGQGLGPDARLWRTSHTGATGLPRRSSCYPKETLWAFADADLVARVVHRRGSLDAVLPHYRGCAGFDSARQQALERAVVAEVGSACCPMCSHVAGSTSSGSTSPRTSSGRAKFCGGGTSVDAVKSGRGRGQAGAGGCRDAAGAVAPGATDVVAPSHPYLFGLGRSESTMRRGSRWRDNGELVGKASALIWLVFLIIPLAGLSGQHASLTRLLVTIAAVVVFAALFCTLVLLPEERSASMSRPVLFAVVIAMWALTVFLVFYAGPSWDYEFIFSVFPALHLLGRRPATVVGIAIGALVVGLLGGLDYGDLALVALLIIGVGMSVFGVSHLIEANEALRQAHSDQTRAAVAEERLRFARDLHDLLGHSLSVISLKSEVAGRLLRTDPGRADQEIIQIQEIARRALREVREAVSGYRQATVAVELAGARTALAAAGIAWQEDIASVELPEDVEAALAWTLREGVTNVVRHAGATCCILCLDAADQQVTVTVRDDGTGGPARRGGPVVYGNGLVGLGERVAAVAGRLEAVAVPGGGFSLQVSVPLAAR